LVHEAVTVAVPADEELKVNVVAIGESTAAPMLSPSLIAVAVPAVQLNIWQVQGSAALHDAGQVKNFGFTSIVAFTVEACGVMHVAVTSTKPNVVGVNSNVAGGMTAAVTSAGDGDVRFFNVQLPASHPVIVQEHFNPASQYEHETSEGFAVEVRLTLFHKGDSHA